jgi:hypothetical protein
VTARSESARSGERIRAGKSCRCLLLLAAALRAALRAARCMTRRRQAHGNIRGASAERQVVVLASLFVVGYLAMVGSPPGRASGKSRLERGTCEGCDVLQLGKHK